MNYKEKGITIIQCQNKKMACRESIKKNHHQINRLIYEIQYQHVISSTSNRLYNELVEIGKEIASEAEKKPLNPKEAEILQKLRQICINLRHIIRNTKPDIDETETARKIQNYSFFAYKKALQSILSSEEDIKNQLEKMKSLRADLEPILKSNFDEVGYKKMQDELLNSWMERYRIY